MSINVDFGTKSINDITAQNPISNNVQLIKTKLNQFIIVQYFDMDIFFYIVSTMH